MKLSFFGGAQTVTGSMHMLNVNGSRILLECGMYQGRRQESYERNKMFPFKPSEIKALVLTHAHIDHSGNIPNLVKHGFTGPIYATPPTVDLCKIMLRDSAFLQEKDLLWVNKLRGKKHLEPIEPLYTMDDVELALDLFVGVDYDTRFTVAAGVEARLLEAGHILGSASIHLEVDDNGKKTSITYAGDIGRVNMPVLHDPNLPRDLDVLIMESTYGNKMHDHAHDREEELAQIVRETASLGGKLIIPAFAVGRTQELVYILHKLYNENRIPEIPIFVDSPMSLKATEVFRKHPECWDRETWRIFADAGEDPFEFSRLTYIHDAEESKRLNHLSYPHVIISASGMAEGGRVLHHLANGIGDRKTTVLFVGFAVKETLARKLIDGEKAVKIFGEEHVVHAQIRKLDTFSAHADRRDLLDYVKFCPPEKLREIFLVHGEEAQALPLRDALRSKGYPSVRYPASGDSVEL